MICEVKNIVVWGKTYLVSTHFEALPNEGLDLESWTEYISELISERRS